MVAISAAAPTRKGAGILRIEGAVRSFVEINRGARRGARLGSTQYPVSHQADSALFGAGRLGKRAV